jgi:hypothetical protein
MQFYDEKHLPTDSNDRLKKAAGMLAFVLKFLERDVPEELLAEANNEYSETGKYEKQLYDILDDLLAKDIDKLNALLDAGTDDSEALLNGWINHHGFTRNYTPDVIRWISKLKDKDGNVAIHHEGGVYTHWIQEGTRSYPDPTSKTHALRMPATNLVARTGEDAGGKFTYMVYPNAQGTSFNIVRVKDGKLITGETSRPNWMS